MFLIYARGGFLAPPTKSKLPVRYFLYVAPVAPLLSCFISHAMGRNTQCGVKSRGATGANNSSLAY